MGHAKLPVPTETTLLAFQRARARRIAATDVEQQARHELIYDARAGGMSVREIATLTGLPKSTVARLGHRHERPSDLLWTTPEDWVAAHNAAWPDRHVDHAPFRIGVHRDGSRSIQLISPLIDPADNDDGPSQ